MLMKPIHQYLLIALVSLICAGVSYACKDDAGSATAGDETNKAAEAGDRDKAESVTYLVDVRSRHDVQANNPTNLSPSLLAVKDGGGVLKGGDEHGKPLIAVSAENAERLKASRAVQAVTADVPKDWTPITRLKVSYHSGQSLDKDELNRLGLKVVEDYRKGSFMIVEPTDQKITAALASKLEDNAKVRYVTPSFDVKSIQARGR